MTGAVGGGIPMSAHLFALKGLAPKVPVTIHAMLGDRRTDRATITIGADVTYKNLVLRFR